MRKCFDKLRKDTHSMFAHQILKTPSLTRLVNSNVVAEVQKFAYDTAEEVGIAVVPIRNQ